MGTAGNIQNFGSTGWFRTDKTHLVKNSCRPYLEKDACGAYRLCTHFFAEIIQPPLSAGLSDEPWTGGPCKVRIGSSGVNPPPLLDLNAILLLYLKFCVSGHTRHLTSYPVQGVQEFTYKEQLANKTGLCFLFKSKIIRPDGEQRDHLWLIKGWDCRTATDVILL